MAYQKCRAAMEKTSAEEARIINQIWNLPEKERYTAMEALEGHPANSAAVFPDLLARTLRQAFIYEFDSDITRLMAMTDNEPHPIHSPFRIVFLDFESPLERYMPSDISWSWGTRFIGLLFTTSESFDSIQTAYIFCEQQDGSVKAISIITDNWELLRTALKEGKIPSEVQKRLMQPWGDDIDKMINAGMRRAMLVEKFPYNFLYNFIDLLETPDVDIIPINRTKANARRLRQGLLPLPDGARVVARRDLRRYIYELQQEKAFQYSHAFWVRGHFRHFRNERYTSSGKRFTKIWIKPYIKGHGVLIKKKYVLDKSFKRVVKTKYEAQQIDRAAEAEKELEKERAIDRKLKTVD